jgi:predicted nuclease of predicted toxin-antitoxin system
MDERVPTAVTEGLRRRGVDVLTVQEANLRSASDNEQLAFARDQERVVFTQDADLLRLHAVGARHAGVVYTHQHIPVGEIIRGLMLIFEVLEPADMVDRVEFVG